MIPHVCGVALFLLLLCSNVFALDFVAAGDVLLDRGIRRAIESNGPNWPLRNVFGLIQISDLAMFNLESSLSSEWRPGTGKYRFMGKSEFLSGLSKAGFNVAVVANNHTCDFGPEGFKETLSALDGASMQYAGLTGRPLVIEKKGVRVAILAYTDVLNATPSPCDRVALAEPSSVKADVGSVRDLVDVVIVSFHWGRELETKPDERQRALAHAAVDSGATLVIGHHPHVLQEMERYKDGLIIYSLGNFLFDNRMKEQSKAALFKCTIEKGRIISPHFIPLVDKGKGPSKAGVEETSQINARLRGNIKGTGLRSFEYPVKEYKTSGFRIVVYRNKISTEDLQGNKVDSITIPFKSEAITDAAYISDSQGSTIYFILKGKKDGRLGFADFDISSGKLGEPHVDSHTEHNPWRIYPCDLNGSGIRKLCVGVRKTTRFDKTIANRLYVYGRSKEGIFPVWFGTRLGLPFLDFAICDIDRDGVEEVITLSKERNGNRMVVSFKHGDFNFDMAGIIEPESKRTGLAGYCLDSAQDR
ncbi:MAG TPA: CapA family protein [Thermodesulfovibrionales bacterium]|nr:CapA family protein [Thermodesulfovibrionales bacterium]